MAKVKTEPRLVQFGPDRKKLGPEILSQLKAGTEGVEVPDDSMYILQKGTYEIISQNKAEEAPKKSKKSKTEKNKSKEE